MDNRRDNLKVFFWAVAGLVVGAGILSLPKCEGKANATIAAAQPISYDFKK